MHPSVCAQISVCGLGGTVHKIIILIILILKEVNINDITSSSPPATELYVYLYFNMSICARGTAGKLL